MREYDAPDLSVIIPVFNEQATLPELYRRLTAILVRHAPEYEVIFVNDGSTDDTWNVVSEWHLIDSRVTAIDLSRNFGHQAAIAAGLRYARGRMVVCMDGDLQDPPELIPELIARFEEGWDVVYAVRTQRKETLLKRTAYRAFYRILRRCAEIRIPTDSGDFALMGCHVVQLINAMPERHRFVRGLRAWVGFRQVGVEYARDARFAGEAQYTWRSLLRLALDGVFSFSAVPLRLATVLGLLVSALSFVGVGVVLWLKLAMRGIVPGWAATVIPILFLGGVQLLTIGILGEYVGRIFDEVKQRPAYIVKTELTVRRSQPAHVESGAR